MEKRRGHRHEKIARDLPPEVWGVVLSKLPEDDLSSRLQASRVSRAARDGERGGDCRVELKLTGRDKQSQLNQLRAFAAWGAARTGAVAATLSAPCADPHLEDSPLSLACLGGMPTLVSLALSLDLPVNYATLASCHQLTALRVTIPQLAGLEYLEDDEDDDRGLFIFEDGDPELVKDVAEESSKFATLVSYSRLLEPGVLSLTYLRSLDVDGLVAPRGDIRVLHLRLPTRSTLPWLTRLTQLTRLKARVFNVDEGAWSLPCLRELHVCGGFRSEECDLEDEDRVPYKINDHLPSKSDKLELVSTRLTKLVLESCVLEEGKVFALKPSVKELHLITCATWHSRVKTSCPGLSQLCVVDNSRYREEAFRVSFRPMPHLTGVSLDMCHYGYNSFCAGETDEMTQEYRLKGFVLPKMLDGRMVSKRNRYYY